MKFVDAMNTIKRVNQMKCRAITKNGLPCGGFAISGSEFCFTHDPHHANQREIAHYKGGQARQAQRRFVKLWVKKVSSFEPKEPVILESKAAVNLPKKTPPNLKK